MKIIKQVCIIFVITMVGEVMNMALPLPIPAGVYGLFLLLAALCTGVIKLEDVEITGNYLMDVMPVMFIPVSVGLIDSFEEIKAVAGPLIIISLVSTVIVLIVTAKVTEWILKKKGKSEKI